MGWSLRLAIGWLLVVLGGLVVLSAAGPAAAGPDTDRYYVVGPPVNGQREYLFQIAAQTLGDGNRYQEIFDLNKGRPQPDGGALTDPLRVEPGWILLLPRDANGAGVRTGPPPTVAATPSPPKSTVDNHHPGTSGLGWAELRGWAGLVGTGALVLTVLLVRRRTRTVAATRGPVRAAVSVMPAALPAGSPARTVAALPLPPPPANPQRVTAAVTLDGCAVDVRLSGSRGPGPAPPYGWLDPTERLPDGALPVVLGGQGPRRLWADLALVPELLTVTGPVTARRRYAAALTRQLCAAGYAVTVVGGVLGADMPPGAHEAGTVPSFDAEAVPRVVVAGGLSGGQAADLRRIASGTDRRVVLVVVGDVLRARWSVVVRPVGAESYATC
jgi:hypothetical protein